jgi:hypothetical protein
MFLNDPNIILPKYFTICLAAKLAAIIFATQIAK